LLRAIIAKALVTRFGLSEAEVARRLGVTTSP
jgi:predicted transcriptional regulator